MQQCLGSQVRRWAVCHPPNPQLSEPVLIRQLHATRCACQGSDGTSGSDSAPKDTSSQQESTPQREQASTSAAAARANVARTLMAHFEKGEAADSQQADTAGPSGRQRARGAGAPALPEADGAALQGKSVLQVLLQAVDNCKPAVQASALARGTGVDYVPKFVPPKLQRSLAVRWIVEAALKRQEATQHKGRKGLSLSECLATELLMAAEKKGFARARRDEMHKIAADNKGNLRGAR